MYGKVAYKLNLSNLSNLMILGEILSKVVQTETTDVDWYFVLN